MSEMSKEAIGLLLQVLAVGIIISYILPRQIRDLGYPDKDVRVEVMKRKLLQAAIVFLILASPPLARLINIVIFGNTSLLLDTIVFWCNRLVFIVGAIMFLVIYKGNTREIDTEEMPVMKKSKAIKKITEQADKEAKE